MSLLSLVIFESPQTDLALQASLACVLRQMIVQVRLVSELFTTVGALNTHTEQDTNNNPGDK